MKNKINTLKKAMCLLLSFLAVASVSLSQQSQKVNAAGGTIPIYRVYNPNSGEHLHTMNDNERANLVRLGWKYEGISMRVSTEGNDLYRMYNPNTGEHFYTLNWNEVINLKNHTWNYEGVAWKTPSRGVAMYRVYNPNAKNAGSHHYTTSEGEYQLLVRAGWRFEGVSWYCVGGAEPVAPTPQPQPTKTLVFLGKESGGNTTYYFWSYEPGGFVIIATKGSNTLHIQGARNIPESVKQDAINRTYAML